MNLSLCCWESEDEEAGELAAGVLSTSHRRGGMGD